MVCKGQEPLCEIPINGTYILGIYKGTLSEFDILLKYRQKEDGKWSRIRTPKHIHYETDLLLDGLLEQWNRTVPLKSKKRAGPFIVPREFVG